MSEISFKINNNTLSVALSGRVDSTNAADTEKGIYDIIGQNSFENLVIDAENLAYISSAGLRVILHLRKEYATLKIVNTSSDVYEIFEMTGFTEMVTIEKAYRQLSIDGCEVIGKGANGEVYRLDPDTIIKVYFNDDALPDIHRERELARKAFVLGIPTAIPYDVVKVGDKYGSVFELLSAKSFTKLLNDTPEAEDEIVDKYVELLKKIHSTEVKEGDMPDMKEIVLGWAKDIKPFISLDKWTKLIDLITAVPEDMHVIHGDYHTKNVMLQNGETLLIDMDTLCHGAPVFEFASIFNAYIGFYHNNIEPDEISFIGIPFKTGVRFFEKAMAKYFDTADEKQLEDIKNKAALVGYTRLVRRTARRLDLSKPENKELFDFYASEIERLCDNVDTLIF